MQVVTEGDVGEDRDFDLYCMQCGYNLRGLAGDPIRCPECGWENPVGDIVLPAPLIARHIRRIETAMTMCTAAMIPLLTAAASLYWTYRIPQMDVCAPSGVFFGMILWIAALRHVRRMCMAADGWLRGAMKYHVYAYVLMASVIAPFVAVSVWYFRWEKTRYSTLAQAIHLPVTAAIGVGAIVLLRWKLPAFVRRLNDTIEPMKRHVATRITREYMRKGLSRPGRRSFFR